MLARTVSIVALIGVAGCTIDFETTPSGGPTGAGDVITNQYNQNPAVVFSLIDGNFVYVDDPVIAKVGSTTPLAFQGPASVTYNGAGCTTTSLSSGTTLLNIPDPSESGTIKCSFLTYPDLSLVGTIKLLISYSTAVQGASGTIIDIDAQESWRVRAFDVPNPTSASIPLQTIHICSAQIASPPSYCSSGIATGNGIGSEFSIFAPGIKSLVIDYATPNAGNVGLAFDNFKPDVELPDPCELYVETTSMTSVLSVGDPIEFEIEITNVGQLACETVRVIDYWASSTSTFSPIDWQTYLPDNMELASLQQADWESPSESQTIVQVQFPSYQYSFPTGSVVLLGPDIPTGDIIRRPNVPFQPGAPSIVYSTSSAAPASSGFINCAIAVVNTSDYDDLRLNLSLASLNKPLTLGSAVGNDTWANNINTILAGQGIYGVSCVGVNVN